MVDDCSPSCCAAFLGSCSVENEAGFETVSFLAKKADEYFSEAVTRTVLIKKV